jgi:hypothetical protein
MYSSHHEPRSSKLALYATLIRPIRPTAHAIDVDWEHVASGNVNPFNITPISGDKGIKTCAVELGRSRAVHRLSIIHIETQTRSSGTVTLVRHACLETKGADGGFGEAC